jgi:hypothetical protein
MSPTGPDACRASVQYIELSTRLEKKYVEFAELHDDVQFVEPDLKYLTEEDLREARFDLAVLQERLAMQPNMIRH